MYIHAYTRIRKLSYDALQLHSRLLQSVAQPSATFWSVDLGGSYKVVKVVVFCWEQFLESMAYNKFSFQNARREELFSWSAPMQP